MTTVWDVDGWTPLPVLRDDVTADVCVIGLGGSGLTAVAELRSRGVRFEVCEITLKNRKLDKNKFIEEAEFTPSGVVRIGRVQAKEGYAYIKP